MIYKRSRGFTLIELLIVIAIIAILAIIVVLNLSNARTKARDVRRKADIKTLSDAVKLRYIDVGNYPSSSGWIGDAGVGSTDSSLTPALVTGSVQYLSALPYDPSGTLYLHFGKTTAGGCTSSVAINPPRYAFYAKLENVSAADSATMTDGCDDAKNQLANFRVGN